MDSAARAVQQRDQECTGVNTILIKVLLRLLVILVKMLVKLLCTQALDVDSAARAVQQRDQDALLAHLTQAQSADTEVHIRQSMA